MGNSNDTKYAAGYKSKAWYKNQLKRETSPKEKAKKRERSAADRKSKKEGRGHVGDNKDVHHKTSLISGPKKASQGGTTLMSASKNRAMKPKGMNKPGPKKGSKNGTVK